MAPEDSHTWSPEQVRLLIRYGAEHEDNLLRYKRSVKEQWGKFLKEIGLDEVVSASQVSKKWEDLKNEYKGVVMLSLKSDQGTDGGELAASTWQYFKDMHEVLSSRRSLEPPVVVASFMEEEETDMMNPCCTPGGGVERRSTVACVALPVAGHVTPTVTYTDTSAVNNILSLMLLCCNGDEIVSAVSEDNLWSPLGTSGDREGQSITPKRKTITS